MRISKSSIIPFIEWVLLAFIAGGFLNKVNYLILFLFIEVVIFKIIAPKNFLVKVTSEFFWLVLCFVSYFMINAFFYDKLTSLYTIMTYLISPIALYIVGLMIIENNEKKLKTIIVIILVGQLIHGIGNLLNMQANGTHWYDKVIIDIWTHEPVTPTLNGSYFTGAIVLSVFFLYQKKIIYKILGIAFIGIFMWSALSTAERTLLIVFALSIFAVVYAKNIFEKKDKAIFIRMLGYTFLLILISAILVLLFVNDAFGVQTAFMSTSLGERMSELSTGMTDDPRLDLSKNVISQLWDSPMGNLQNIPYAHNLFLDIGRVSGIIPMFLMFGYICSVLITLLKFCKKDNVSINTKILVFLLYFSYMLVFMIEPVLEGIPLMFNLFCLINGSVVSMCLNKNEIISYAKK